MREGVGEMFKTNTEGWLIAGRAVEDGTIWGEGRNYSVQTNDADWSRQIDRMAQACVIIDLSQLAFGEVVDQVMSGPMGEARLPAGTVEVGIIDRTRRAYQGPADLPDGLDRVSGDVMADIRYRIGARIGIKTGMREITWTDGVESF